MKRSGNARFKSGVSWAVMMQAYGQYCSYCMTEPAQSVDHVIPWSISFCDEIWNLRPCCMWCNLRAGDKLFDSFEDKQNYLRRERQKDGRNLKYRTICTTCFLPYQRPNMTTSMFECPECYGGESTPSQKESWRQFIYTMEKAGIDMGIHKIIRGFREEGMAMDRARDELGELYMMKVLKYRNDDTTLEEISCSVSDLGTYFSADL